MRVLVLRDRVVYSFNQRTTGVAGRPSGGVAFVLHSSLANSATPVYDWSDPYIGWMRLDGVLPGGLPLFMAVVYAPPNNTLRASVLHRFWRRCRHLLDVGVSVWAMGDYNTPLGNNPSLGGLSGAKPTRCALFAEQVLSWERGGLSC
eukprot:Lithocolla_globosa_v1_NODE_218_length_5069_cov_37.778620.p5 type:complete len:147 gc:universal NODE_218_length_5069_cov_37.778620:2728-2288(-)